MPFGMLGASDTLTFRFLCEGIPGHSKVASGLEFVLHGFPGLGLSVWTLNPKPKALNRVGDGI